MNGRKFNPAELTEERSLFEIWKKSRQIPVSTFNQLSTAAVLVALAAFALFTDIPVGMLAEWIRKWAELGFNYSGTMLGLLLAGFSLTATLGKPDYFRDMARIVNKNTGLSYLKDFLFAFLKVFIIYLGFAVLCLAVIIFGSANGPLSAAVSVLPGSGALREFIVKIGFVLVGGAFFHTLMVLKSFVYNVYISVMSALRYELEKPHQH